MSRSFATHPLTRACVLALVSLLTPVVSAQRRGARSTPPAAPSELSREAPADSPVLALQVLLDRAHFSTGEIDGRRGVNTTRALAAWAHATGRDGSEAAAIAALGGADVSPLASYVITDADVAGPFAGTLPSDMMALAQLPALPYVSVIEALGERFHASPLLLQRLNPRAAFTAGEDIRVPNVAGVAPPAPARGATVVVAKQDSNLRVIGPSGEVLFYAPVTSGSVHDPLPIGHWSVTGVARNPSFNYNPDLFWDADPSHARARIPPGPNNPVGVVWIDITKPHYGLHGTPEPSQIGHTTSHGCVRLTNWDAMTLASLVSHGTVVEFVE